MYDGCNGELRSEDSSEVISIEIDVIDQIENDILFSDRWDVFGVIKKLVELLNGWLSIGNTAAVLYSREIGKFVTEQAQLGGSKESNQPPTGAQIPAWSLGNQVKSEKTGSFDWKAPMSSNMVEGRLR